MFINMTRHLYDVAIENECTLSDALVHTVDVRFCILTQNCIIRISLVPRLPQNTNVYHGESLVSFLRKHDVIKIGPEQKGNILYIVQPTMSSTLCVYDIRPLIARYM